MSYEIALERIAKARKEKSTYLNLSRLSLDKIPRQLNNLPYILRLDLSTNKLNKIERLKGFHNLKELYLYNNKINKIENLENFTKLTELWLDNNLISELENLEKLTNLNVLRLNDNQISKIESLENLAKLTELLIKNNRIDNTQGLDKQMRLKVLDLTNNQLTKIEGLHGLVKIERLQLSQNQISKIENLENLAKLKILKLQKNNISEIEGLDKLTNLTQLWLQNNQITEIKGLDNLTQLSILTLGNNQINEIKGLDKLKQLTQLWLGNNQINEIKGLNKLTNLTQLWLQNNQISKIPLSLLDFKLNILWTTAYIEKGISIGDNPITTPPIETVQQGNKAIRNYYKQLQKGKKQYLLEAKLLLVGSGGAGKTTLAKKIKEGIDATPPTEDDTTRGIEIHHYDFPVTAKEKLKDQNFRMNIWDFGGQEIYHSTHQFFLTRRSLYVLVMDARTEGNHVNYWSQVVDLLSEGSPMLIVENQKQGYKQVAFNFPAYQARFPNICGPMMHSNFKDEPQTLEKIIAAIKYHIQFLPGIGDELPEAWVNVRKAIEKEEAAGKNYISIERYVELCEIEELNYQQALRLSSDYLHPVGVFLHFQNNPVLKNTVILKNTWATDAVYAVLKHDKIVKETQGRFSKVDLNDIWSAPKYERKQGELLELMKEFEICYQTDDGQTYIAPQLLPDKQPKYHLPKGINTTLFYDYGFMPKGLLHRFIVRNHRLIVREEWMWQQGVVLHLDEHTYATVIESYDNKQIHIQCVGEQPKKLMDKITHEIDAINHTFKRIKVEKKVRCNCRICKGAVPTTEKEAPTYYDYSDLERRLARRKATIECKFSYDDVNVVDLLLDVFTHLPGQTGQTKIFISYSKEDVTFKNELIKFLQPLEPQIALFHDRQILPGNKWDDEIQKELKSSDIILCLVSSDFLATEYVMETEIPIALDMQESGQAVVIPVILRPCGWKDTALANFNALPSKGIDVDSFDSRDKAWKAVYDGIRKVIA